ncbi:Uncharacterized protein GcC1_006003 [Golovinomyces cichoracearum]|uniref:Integral membrane protein n=1 Tax=Golovinomyces cichoracearum TaxID=62708 RepID=A0A420J8L8_9PEZI|nr:Uncharacterized protein GcC1_006003 [Golovinomyces cichoracearum]
MALKVRLTNPAPLDYKTPPWPSLYWPLDERIGVAKYLYFTRDIWLYTLLWTLVMFAGTHGIVAIISVVIHVGKGHRSWQYAWATFLALAIIAGIEAIMAGSVVGLILGAVYESGYFKMSTWIPFVWGIINVLFLIVSSFSYGSAL